MTVDVGLVAFHDMGDESAGEPWRRAAAGVEWTGEIHIPDLPGHRGAEPIVGRSYDIIDPANEYAQFLAAHPNPESASQVVLGVGGSAWAAQLVTIAGHAGALVVVDGLQGPFVSVAAHMADRRQVCRDQAAANIAAMADPSLAEQPAGGNDPRLAHFPQPLPLRSNAIDAAKAVSVPTLIIESDASGTPADDVDMLVDLYARDGHATLERMPVAAADLVMATVVTWLTGLDLS